MYFIKFDKETLAEAIESHFNRRGFDSLDDACVDAVVASDGPGSFFDIILKDSATVDRYELVDRYEVYEERSDYWNYRAVIQSYSREELDAAIGKIISAEHLKAAGRPSAVADCAKQLFMKRDLSSPESRIIRLALEDLQKGAFNFREEKEWPRDNSAS